MKKGITIVLDKPRTLRYGMNALAKIEDITGKSILALDLNKVGIKDLLAIVYGGLYHEDKTLTIDKVGDLIDEYSNLTDVAEKYALSGLLICSECGSKFRRCGRPLASGEKVSTWVCINHQKKRNECNMRPLKENDIIEAYRRTVKRR